VTFHEKIGGKCRTAVGAVTPYALQHLLDRAKWDCDEVRDVLRVYVWETLASPDTVLVIDETGGSRKRDTNRWGCNASTVVQLDASRIARWVCSAPQPVRVDTRYWTVNSICRNPLD
jgi:hypothetical protein